MDTIIKKVIRMKYVLAASTERLDSPRANHTLKE
jgi:hypothetical protein